MAFDHEAARKMKASWAWLALCILFRIGDPGPAIAQTAPPQNRPPAAGDLKTLETLLAKPEIRAWLEGRLAETPEPRRDESLGATISGQLDSARAHIQEMAETAPQLPAELNSARVRLVEQLRTRPIFAIGLPVLLFVALGFGLERLFYLLTGTLRRRIRAKWLDTPAGRLRVIGLRLLYGCGEIVAFAVGSIGAFLLFRWPDLLQRSVLTYLVVFLSVRLTLILTRIALSKDDPRYRLLPMSDTTARYWLVWMTAIVGLFILGKFTLDLLPEIGISASGRDLIEIAFGFSQLVLVLTVLWRAPLFSAKGYVARKYVVTTWIVTLGSTALWIFALAGKGEVFSAGLIVLSLPFALRGVRLAVDHLFRPPEDSKQPAVPAGKTRPVLAVAVDRGISAVLLLLAVYVIAAVSGVDVLHFADRETTAVRFFRGLINAAVVVLISDCIWQMCKAWIDSRLQEASSGDRYFHGEAARKNARTRTLLPVLRNMLGATLLVVAALMVLAALGVEIGPLIAGAGVVGVAVGFGAQTLVKDIIAGIFFLFDDAFRAGEYIESGTISGTVEAFSVRSIKLRHALGALHTIPFGALSTITNYSRDWVIDQMMLNVPFDADLDRIREIVETIGKELAADKRFGAAIIDPLRFQGVEKFGDFAIQICLRQMTRPGEQHAVRRQAYQMLQKAFTENGLSFAFPAMGAPPHLPASALPVAAS
jgi:small-conductance mechanosensitive channel